MSGTKKTKQWGRQNTLQITVEEWAIQLVLEKIEGRKRRGQQRMRWLDSITDSVDEFG